MTKTKDNQSSLSNVKFVNFGSRSKSKKQTEDTKAPFDDLAKKLEQRIHGIEKNLQDSLIILENDVEKLLKVHNPSDITEDLERLSKIVETRVASSIDNLIATSTSKYNKEELKFIKDLTSQLTKLLSADMYRNILERLSETTSQTDVDEFGLDSSIIQKIKPFFDFLYYKYWRVETTGINHIPNNGKALIVANHSGGLPYDGSMLGCAIYNEHPVRKDARFLVENFVYHMPFLGSFMYKIGGVRACPENAERLLEHGHLVIVFPEGVKGIGKYYTQRYQLQRFGRGGFIKLCIKTDSPLIPVGIVGAEEIHPIIFKSNIMAKTIGVPYIPITPTFPLMGLLGMIPFPTKWSIHFGEPRYFDSYKDKALKDELQIHKLSEAVREDIQDILIQLLKKRKNVWFG